MVYHVSLQHYNVTIGPLQSISLHCCKSPANRDLTWCHGDIVPVLSQSLIDMPDIDMLGSDAMQNGIRTLRCVLHSCIALDSFYATLLHCDGSTGVMVRPCQLATQDAVSSFKGLY